MIEFFGLAEASPPSFKTFGAAHVAVLAVCVPVMAALGVLGARWRGAGRGRTLHRGWLVFVTLTQIVNLVYWASPPNLSPADSLPLHICDLAGIAAVFDLISPRRFWRIIMYYWGIGLSTQAFVTPIITDGPDTFRFYLFFASHLTIVGTPVYDLATGRFRPGWGDCGRGILFGATYVLVMMGFDLATGFNYGFVGKSKPEQPTIIDTLGGWPLRVLWMSLLVTTLFALITLPWTLRRAGRGPGATAPPPPLPPPPPPPPPPPAGGSPRGA